MKEVGYSLPKKSDLLECWNKNPHGAGFMFNDNGKVIIKKGYMNFDDFYNELIRTDTKKYLKNRGLVIHFRIATSGLIDKGNCHPYPLSSVNDDLRNTFCISFIYINGESPLETTSLYPIDSIRLPRHPRHSAASSPVQILL